MSTTQPHAMHEKLSFKEKLGYGLGDSASNFFFQGLQYLPSLLLHRRVWVWHPQPLGRCFWLPKL